MKNKGEIICDYGWLLYEPTIFNKVWICETV